MSVGMGQQVDPLSEDTARNYFRQIILAIEYLHENGIVSSPLRQCLVADDSFLTFVDTSPDSSRYQARKYFEDVG
jgi:[calcium/calmodulin-dependent protein kinase] kinase